MGIGNRLISDRPVSDSIKKFLVDELVGTTIALDVSLSFVQVRRSVQNGKWIDAISMLFAKTM